jgi:hypothetical protein
MFRILSPWKSNGELRPRGYSGEGADSADQPGLLQSKSSATESTQPKQFREVSVGNGSSNGGFETYTVNVKSAGADRTFSTWDDIWSYPDDPSEW